MGFIDATIREARIVNVLWQVPKKKRENRLDPAASPEPRLARSLALSVYLAAKCGSAIGLVDALRFFKSLPDCFIEINVAVDEALDVRKRH